MTGIPASVAFWIVDAIGKIFERLEYDCARLPLEQPRIGGRTLEDGTVRCQVPEQGDQPALAELLHRWDRPLHAFIARHTGDNDVEDLRPATPAPPRWKQGVVIWLTFFPLSLALGLLFAALDME